MKIDSIFEEFILLSCFINFIIPEMFLVPLVHFYDPARRPNQLDPKIGNNHYQFKAVSNPQSQSLDHCKHMAFIEKQHANDLSLESGETPNFYILMDQLSILQLKYLFIDSYNIAPPRAGLWSRQNATCLCYESVSGLMNSPHP